MSHVDTLHFGATGGDTRTDEGLFVQPRAEASTAEALTVVRAIWRLIWPPKGNIAWLRMARPDLFGIPNTLRCVRSVSWSLPRTGCPRSYVRSRSAMETGMPYF